MKNQISKNQTGSSRMDTVLKLLMIAFFSLFAFSSGVYFGKQVSDSDYQLKSLESDFKGHDAAKAEGKAEGVNEAEVTALSEKFVNSEREVAGEKSEKAAHGSDGHEATANETGSHDDAEHGTADAHGEKPKEAVSAKHDEHEKHEAAPNDKHEDEKKHADAKHGDEEMSGEKSDSHDEHVSANADHELPVKNEHKASKNEDHEKKSEKPDLSAAHDAAVRVAHDHSPIDESKKPETTVAKRQPASLPQVVGASQEVEFTVQVASYPSLEVAKAHVERLIKKGLPAFPFQAQIGGKTYYRVSVGSFKSMKDAASFRAQLLKEPEVEAAIVQKIKR